MYGYTTIPSDEVNRINNESESLHGNWSSLGK